MASLPGSSRLVASADTQGSIHVWSSLTGSLAAQFGPGAPPPSANPRHAMTGLPTLPCPPYMYAHYSMLSSAQARTQLQRHPVLNASTEIRTSKHRTLTIAGSAVGWFPAHPPKQDSVQQSSSQGQTRARDAPSVHVSTPGPFTRVQACSSGVAAGRGRIAAGTAQGRLQWLSVERQTLVSSVACWPSDKVFPLTCTCPAQLCSILSQIRKLS